MYLVVCLPTTDTSIKVITNTITLACPVNTLHIIGVDSDTNAYVSYYWDFGNGQTSTSSHPSVYYDTPGNYTITLYGTDSVGNKDTLIEYVTVPDCNAQRIVQQNDSIPQNTSNENTRKFSCIIQPNPNNGKFNILIGNSEQRTSEVHIEIYNMLGEKIYSKELSIGNSSRSDASFGQESINLSTQPAGIYLLRVIDNGKAYSKKIIKQ